MTMISCGVEISIAGGGGEMVCVPIPWLVFSFFSFLFFSSLFLFVLRYNGHVSASYVDKKPLTTVHPASPG